MWLFDLKRSIPFLILPVSGFLWAGGQDQGQGRDTIIFPHQLHVEELELECEQCHEGVGQSVSLGTRLLPEEEDCLECHDGDVATDECSACHASPDKPQTYRELFLEPGPTFSHVSHLRKRPNCSDCHDTIISDDGTSLPTVWRGQDCRACHESAPPDNHTPDWIQVHGMQVTHLTEQNCNLCHSESACDACHQLQQFEPKVHPVSYIFSHGFDARSGVADCSSCHRVQEDCQTCHHENQVMPMDHNFPDWVVLSSVAEDGGLHASAALDAPDVCIACHEPQAATCERCHD